VTTLATLRGKLNNEIGVVTDADTAPWSVAARNQAISDGYAALWRVGVWKPVTQDLSTVTDQWPYALTTIRALDRLEVLDSSQRLIERPRGLVEPNGSGGWQLRLVGPVATGYTLRVRGWTAYVSSFANDAANDDLPAEHNRIPLLKAKAILFRTALGSYARYGERQAAPPLMNITVDQFIGLISAAEREFTDEAKALARLRPRTGQSRSI
jgi:hypothetical protein